MEDCATHFYCPEMHGAAMEPGHDVSVKSVLLLPRVPVSELSSGPPHYSPPREGQQRLGADASPGQTCLAPPGTGS